ncbi:hypothetical protein [Maribacter sp. 2307ULW6-5]|uniref:hypothetical protein n=1 Tax=Maribacter sp. 2307ULW6-5 TaxID=3386275 RepID=UPI0039BCDCEA
MKKKITFLLAVGLVMSCHNEEFPQDDSLAGYLANAEVQMGNVIACAASNQNNGLVSVFLYPRPGATNIRYFEARDGAVARDNFSAYEAVEAPLLDVFNGFLKKFEVSLTNEKWVLVSFEEAGRVHLSNPIKIKNATRPTEYATNKVQVEANTLAPLITWEEGRYDDTVIYFQVVADANGSLISGTYTTDTFFRFYDLDNVVLNITPSAAPQLQDGQVYGVTLMGVSEDNWVNLFATQGFVP